MRQNFLAEKRYILFFGTLGVLKGVLSISEIIRDLLEHNRDIFLFL
jgi:hypothetical protein